MNNSLGELVCYCNSNKRTIYKKSECDNLFYGRGYVQLTWYDNYLKASRSLGIDLLNHPDLALDPSNAAKIMLYGMTYGWFTGRKNSDYLRLDDADYDNARRIINGKDKSKLIASYADTFETIIRRSVV
jgi:predicted chitinase